MLFGLDLNYLLYVLENYTVDSLGILAFFWGVHLINWLFSYRFNYWGIIPRHPVGLRGIVFAPVLHGDANHLFFNSVPLYFLCLMTMVAGIPRFISITLCIIIVGGFMIWCFARKGIHIGASALIMGYFGQLATSAYYQPNVLSVLLLVLCLYYFGGLVLGLMPTKKGVSWEGHVMGFIAGMMAFFLASHLDFISNWLLGI